MTKLWKVIRALIQITEGDIVFIGGIAVYLYTAAHKALPAEVTHDVDAALSFLGEGALRDVVEVVPNERLMKKQVTIENIEIDLYVEYQSGLRFDYQELVQHAVVRRKLKLAALGHLLLLKVDALRQRGTTSKGPKDRRDVAKLLVLLATAPKTQRDLVVGHATSNDLQLLDTVLRSSAFMEITKRNAKAAADLRKLAQRAYDAIVS